MMSQESHSPKKVFNVVVLLQKKRDGQKLSREEIHWLIEEFTRGTIPDYQMTAFLMAAYLNGLDSQETAVLTNAMLQSGTVLPLLSPQAVDKHSTGGVGDKTSFILAPAAALHGVFVPMIAGRGLGHTGGTVDKIESVPGFNTALSLNDFCRQVKKEGLALMGATDDIAPADRKIYALRDVTSTVESIPLITASIMSKKLAEGTSGLVMDIKTGQGAFMKTLKDARELAGSLKKTAVSHNKNIMTVISDMSTPLGRAIGNSLEIKEVLEVLKGEGPDDLMELSALLAGGMIHLAKPAIHWEEGKEMALKSFEDGRALECFRRLIESQGGDPAITQNPDLLPMADETTSLSSPSSGYVSSMNCLELGHSVTLLGGGRMKQEDTIDFGVGIHLHKKKGERVKKGETILDIHHRKGQEELVETIKHNLLQDISFSIRPPDSSPLVKEIDVAWSSP